MAKKEILAKKVEEKKKRRKERMEEKNWRERKNGRKEKSGWVEDHHSSCLWFILSQSISLSLRISLSLSFCVFFWVRTFSIVVVNKAKEFRRVKLVSKRRRRKGKRKERPNGGKNSSRRKGLMKNSRCLLICLLSQSTLFPCLFLSFFFFLSFSLSRKMMDGSE